MKKYFFPIGILMFVILLAMGITNYTQPSKPTEAKIIEGWKHIIFDPQGNSYYIKINSIVNDNQDGEILRFHATFQKLYSDKGREELIEAYKDQGIDISEMSKVDHEIDIYNFKDVNGDKFITGATSKFYTVDNIEIPSIEMIVKFDENSDLKPIPGKTIIEHLYDYAYTRVKKD